MDEASQKAAELIKTISQRNLRRGIVIGLLMIALSLIFLILYLIVQSEGKKSGIALGGAVFFGLMGVISLIFVYRRKSVTHEIIEKGRNIVWVWITTKKSNNGTLQVFISVRTAGVKRFIFYFQDSQIRLTPDFLKAVRHFAPQAYWGYNQEIHDAYRESPLSIRDHPLYKSQHEDSAFLSGSLPEDLQILIARIGKKKTQAFQDWFQSWQAEQ